MKETYCMKCGLIKKYKIIPSPHKNDDENFKYSECLCGSIQPLCMGVGCIDVTNLSCPDNEENMCSKIITIKKSFKKDYVNG